ncbi:hypothetical protein BASA81_003908 [Batrachochytrium salamandrivorans]|nr:hypothetical protein BASA81_003908 [Batrachochytrium salamandrivorans]
MASNSVSTFAILSSRGDTIISREFREDTGSVHRAAEIFFRAARFGLNSLNDGMEDGGSTQSVEESAPPVFALDGIHYISTKTSSGLYFLCTSKYNVSPNLILELLARLAKTFRDFLGVLTEESIRKNFVLVYELLDEVLDFGFPLQTSTETLKQFVWNDPITINASAASFKIATPKLGRISAGSNMNQSVLPSSMLSQSSRLAASFGLSFPSSSSLSGGHSTASTGGTTGPRNEIFVDILERVTFVFTGSGVVINSEVDGSIVMKSFLQNNPELRVSLNENLSIGGGGGGMNTGGMVHLDDANFHECVKLDELEQFKSLVFVPPEGEFVLMNYRVTGLLHAPFRIHPVLQEVNSTQLELYIRLRADVPTRNYGTNVQVRFPVPRNTSAVSLSVESGDAEYHPQDNKVVWTIKKFQGGTELNLKAKISLREPTSSARREIGPISMEFEIPMLSSSNLQVRSLKTTNPHTAQNPHRWVRYITQAASYTCRVNS